MEMPCFGLFEMDICCSRRMFYKCFISLFNFYIPGCNKHWLDELGK